MRRRAFLRGILTLLACTLLGQLALAPRLADAAGPWDKSRAQRADSTFLAGFFKYPFTPTHDEIATGRIRLGGYDQGTVATRSYGHLYARSIALAEQDGSNPLLITMLDLPGINRKRVDEIRRRVAERTGVAAERIFVGVTHVHTGPDLQGLWGGVPAEYAERVIAAATYSLVQAWEKREPALLKSATAEGPETRNRRGWGSTDRDVSVLTATSVATERPLGVVVNATAHPVLSPSRDEASADFCGPLNFLVEEFAGGVSVLINGPLGDVVPLPPEAIAPASDVVARNRQMHEFGTELGKAALAAVDRATPVGGTEIHLATEAFEQPVTNPALIDALRHGVLDYEVTWAGPEPTPILPLEASALSIGQRVEAAFLPGEALTRLGQEIKSAMAPGRTRFFGSMMNNSVGYLIPEDEFHSDRNRGYEARVSLDPRIGENARIAALLALDRIADDRVTARSCISPLRTREGLPQRRRRARTDR